MSKASSLRKACASSTLRALGSLVAALAVASAIAVACTKRTRDDDTTITRPLGLSTAALPANPSLPPPDARETRPPPIEPAIPLSPGAIGGTSPAPAETPGSPEAETSYQGEYETPDTTVPGTPTSPETPATPATPEPPATEPGVPPSSAPPPTTTPEPPATPTPAPGTTTPTPAPGTTTPTPAPGTTTPAPAPGTTTPAPGTTTPTPEPTSSTLSAPATTSPSALFGSPAQAMQVRVDGGVPVVPPPVDAAPIQFDAAVRDAGTAGVPGGDGGLR